MASEPSKHMGRSILGWFLLIAGVVATLAFSGLGALLTDTGGSSFGLGANLAGAVVLSVLALIVGVILLASR